jgi:cardiolipin synthase
MAVIPATDWLDTLSRFWPHLAAGFHFLAALLASIHALLHKRDPRAATLWLATSWLLPMFGPMLYLVFGFNRIRRRAISFGVHATTVRPISEISGEPRFTGVEHLESGSTHSLVRLGA